MQSVCPCPGMEKMSSCIPHPVVSAATRCPPRGLLPAPDHSLPQPKPIALCWDRAARSPSFLHLLLSGASSQPAISSRGRACSSEPRPSRLSRCWPRGDHKKEQQALLAPKGCAGARWEPAAMGLCSTGGPQAGGGGRWELFSAVLKGASACAGMSLRGLRPSRGEGPSLRHVWNMLGELIICCLREKK